MSIISFRIMEERLEKSTLLMQKEERKLTNGSQSCRKECVQPLLDNGNNLDRETAPSSVVITQLVQRQQLLPQ